MITTVNKDSSTTALSEAYASYGDSFGMYQMALDNIREEASLFQLFAQHDVAEMACVDEASIAALNEVSIKDIKDKVVSVLKAFVEKVKQIVSRFIAKMNAAIDMWSKMANHYAKVAKEESWGKTNKTITASYFDFSELSKMQLVLAIDVDLSDESLNVQDWFNGKIGLKGDGSVSELVQNAIIKKDVKFNTSVSDVSKLCDNLKKVAFTIKLANSMIKEANNMRSTLLRSSKLTKADAINNADNKKEFKSSDEMKQYATFATNVNKVISMYTQYIIAIMSTCVKGGNMTGKALKELIAAGKSGKDSSDGKAEEKAKNEGGISGMFGLQMFDEDGWSAEEDQTGSDVGDIGTADTNDVSMPDDNSFGEPAPDPDAQFEAAMKFWNAPIMEADADEFIEPGDPVDDPETPATAEDDFYATNPDDHKEADDLMKQDDSTEEVQVEAFFGCDDLY